MEYLQAILVAVSLTLIIVAYFVIGVAVVAASKSSYLRWLASERYWKRCHYSDAPDVPDFDWIWPITLFCLPSLVLIKGSGVLMKKCLLSSRR